jgi:FAD/FMN-containing dehydrogenase
MHRRTFLKYVPIIPSILSGSTRVGESTRTVSKQVLRRVRPSDPSWPSVGQWEALRVEVKGRLAKVTSLLAECDKGAGAASCADLFKNLQNPYYLGDQPGATQLWGWAKAWTSTPSAYVVSARTAFDVATAVNFARRNNLRLVVKGGGHSYQGTSNSKDSILIWTRAMNDIVLHDAFLCEGAPVGQGSKQAVSVGAGAMWMDVYDSVTTDAGRYVQGGGCATVGVAGLIQNGGFGSFSKRYGLAASHLLQAEIVTADGVICVANAYRNADLFWALKGGGGGTFGVVTRLTLKVHELPKVFGDISVRVKANSDAAFRKLIAAFLDFYNEKLFNPHWGESVHFSRGNIFSADLVFQGLEKQEASEAWQKFLADVTALSPEIVLQSPLFVEAMPAQKWWDVDYLEKYSPGSVLTDPRPDAPRHHAWWTGDKEQVGSFIQSYKSTWLPETLLRPSSRALLADALFAASRYWSTSLHFNKGLAGAPEDALMEARNTALNPSVLDAFALAIISAESPADYTGGVIKNPGLSHANETDNRIGRAMGELKRVAPNAGSYLSESDFFEENWHESFWGSNYERLRRVKRKYDPTGLFFVRHGVGSEDWSDDGFTHLA